MQRLQENRNRMIHKVDGSKPVEITKSLQAEVASLIKQIFDKVDTNKDGKLSLQEFKTGFSEHPDICMLFKQV